MFSGLFGGYSLALKLTGHAVSGFTTVILLQLIIGSMLMLLLGVMGEYVARIFDEVKHRPRFLVSEEADLGSSSSSLPPVGVSVRPRSFQSSPTTERDSAHST